MARFVPNRRLPKELERDIRYVHGLAEEAQRAADAAKAIAPVRTGAYRDSIGVEIEGSKVSVVATDFKAWWIEKGTSRLPPRAPLRRGAQNAGLDLRADTQ